ncbi:MAG TPA: zeta toxin family protein [Bacteroidia bacterium]|nr:zeta toxin family protein [Bacteroidia bacterium]
MSKTIEIFAGPNGSGKTTFAKSLLENRKNFMSFNSDVIASGLTKGAHDSIQFEAGRFMLHNVEKAISTQKSFAFETTFSGKLWSNHLIKAKEEGYHIIIYFLFVDSIELSLKRIQKRVKAGGHNVDKKIVKRRYKRTFRNMVDLYSKLADEWFVINNSGQKPKVVAFNAADNLTINDKKIFNKYFL